MKQNIFKQVALIGFFLISIVACEDKLNIFDKNNPTTESFFKTAIELQNGVNAIYSTLRSGQLVGREWFFTHDMRGGEFFSRRTTIGSSQGRIIKGTLTCPL